MAEYLSEVVKVIANLDSSTSSGSRIVAVRIRSTPAIISYHEPADRITDL